MTSSLSSGQDEGKRGPCLPLYQVQSQDVLGGLAGIPMVAVIIVTWDGCSFYHCRVTNSTDFVAKQNQPFYYAHGFSGSGIQKGHNKDGSSLLHDV